MNYRALTADNDHRESRDWNDNLRKPGTYRLTWTGLALSLILTLAAGVAADTVCRFCGDPIGGSYVQYNGEFYHTNCYTNHIAPRCGICNEPLEGRWIVFDGKSYHQSCYEAKVALRCSVCGEIITGEYLIDHWGNKYHAHHRQEIESCSFCGRLLSDPKAGGGRQFDTDHHICNACDRDAVVDKATGGRLLNQARVLLEKAGIVIDHDHIEFELVSRQELTEQVGRSNTDHFGLIHYEKTTTWSLLTEREFTVFLLKGQPSRHFMSVAAHELMHIWLYLNAPDDGDKILVEGSCNYAAFLVLQQLRDEMAGYVIEQLQSDPDPVYGEGFRRVKKLVDNRGVGFWLEHLRFDPQFPIGY